MNIYATSGLIANDFGLTPSQVMHAIETLCFPEIIDQHIEIFDLGVHKIAQMSEVGFNAVVLNLPTQQGGNDDLILRWRAAFLSNQGPEIATLTGEVQPINSDPPVQPNVIDEKMRFQATAQINQGHFDALLNESCQTIYGQLIAQLSGDPGYNAVCSAVMARRSALGMLNYIPINDPHQYVRHVQAVMTGIYDFMELTKEEALAPVINGVRVYFEEDGKMGFQAASQYHRPTEFLQALLDMIHVNFEPDPLSTFALNSNMGCLYEEIAEQPCHFGYFSLISAGRKAFHEIWCEEVIPHAHQCGYFLEETSSQFVAVTTSSSQYDVPWVDEVVETLKAGTSVPAALGLITANLTAEATALTNKTFVGFCVDEALVDQMRISVWLLIKQGPQEPRLLN